MGRRPGYLGGYNSDREAQLERDPWCAHCGAPATEADHQPPLALHDHVDGSGCCVLVSSCAPCGRKQGGELAQAARNITKRTASGVEIIEPDPIPADDPCWDVRWLDDLRDVPAEAVWPRFLTAPHPEAVGSLGQEVEASALARDGIVLRWWQRLVLRMLLQVDAAGVLLIEWMLASTARQLGKSWGMRELGWWRMHSADRFGEKQEVLHTARTFAPARDVLRPVAERHESPGHPVTRAANEWRFEWRLDGSTWLVIAHGNAYQRSASLALVDEAWGVPVAAVSEGIEPTIVEREQSQLCLWSTAHRRATALVPSRRVTALENLRTPTEGLICEWSAPRSMDLDDPAAHRMASPHWSRRRARLVMSRATAALRGEGADENEPDPIEAFRGQWLNQWPAKIAAGGKGDDLVDVDDWASGALDELPAQTGAAVLAVEDYHGNGCGAVIVTECDARYAVQCWTFPRRDDLVRWAANVAGRPGTVIGGVTLAGDPKLRTAVGDLVPHGATETGPALSLFRELVSAHRVVHARTDVLDGQVAACRVRAASSGLAVVSKDRDDLVRCAAWACRYIDQGLAMVPGVG